MCEYIKRKLNKPFYSLTFSMLLYNIYTRCIGGKTIFYTVCSRQRFTVHGKSTVN